MKLLSRTEFLGVVFALSTLPTLTVMAQTLESTAKLPVVASFSILGDLTRTIGGDRVNVRTLVGPDQDAHVFEAKPSDVKTVGAAKMLVSNGLGFDSWMGRLVQSSGTQAPNVVASAGITPLKEAVEPGKKAPIDPHAFQDPSQVMAYVRNISAALAKADPAGAVIYQRNAAAYQAELEKLDADLKALYNQIPLAKRKVITSHDAFGYLAARYQITFLAPQGLSTESEASAKQVALLIRQVKRENIKALHVENMTNPKLLDQLSREAGVTLGANLYADALGAVGSSGDTYLKMMRHNAAELVKSMQRN